MGQAVAPCDPLWFLLFFLGAGLLCRNGETRIACSAFQFGTAIVNPNPRSLSAILPQVAIAALVVVVGMSLLMWIRPPAVDTAPVLIHAQDGQIDIMAMGYAAPASPEPDRLARQQATAKAIAKAIALFIDPASQRQHAALLDRELLGHSERFIRLTREDGPVQTLAGGVTALAQTTRIDVDAVRRSLLELLRDQPVGYTRPLVELAREPATAPLARRLALRIIGLPDATIAVALQREFIDLRPVLTTVLSDPTDNPRYELVLAGSASDPVEAVATIIMAPLERRFGKRCFGVNGRSGQEVTLAFAADCRDEASLGRLNMPPP